MRYFIHSLILATYLLLGVSASWGENAIHVYLDADQTGARASGISIEQGIRTALHEVGNNIAGRKIKLIVKDHHGSSVRSKKHLDEYLKDNKALAVFSGLHSPPLLDNLNFINENEILILDPWAAAGPITRFNSLENWVFRLSIDDSKAGSVIVNNAIKEGLTKPYLLLEDTGWGKSNSKTMSKALKLHGVEPVGTQWFNWNLGITGAKVILRKIVASGADSIFLVANANEGKTFARAMLDLKGNQRLPIRSHWGITGGDFPEIINAQSRKRLDIKFLQTRFSFISSKKTPFSNKVFSTAKSLWPSLLDSKYDLKAPTGFIHAYDLTRLMISAMTNVEFSGDTIKDRRRLRESLENISTPVKGLIKTYKMPFKPFSKQNPDAHEALSIKDLVMAYYGDKNQIILDIK